VDIFTDISDVQARIAQIATTSGGFSAPAADVPQGGFSAALAQALGPQTTAPMVWPAQGAVSSPFGLRQDPFGGGTEFHPGIDIAAEENSPIIAAGPGRVIQAGPDGGYGNVITIDHGDGVVTKYAHCDALLAHAGDMVTQGQEIATVGSTGRSTGPHVHFEVRLNGAPVDPTKALPVQ